MDRLKKLEQSIFRINTAKGSGTGFYLANKNIIITNYHVVAGFKRVSVEDKDRNRVASNVVYVNPGKDIAFIEAVNKPDGDSVQLNSEIKISSGGKVNVIGYPFGMPLTITEGIISNPEQIIDGQKYIQTDAAINPGNSGGPMIDLDGNLVGIVVSKFNNADNIGFAISGETLMAELEELGEIGNTFSVGCHSCGSLVPDNAEYCENCGADIDEAVFKEQELSPVAIKVEEALKLLEKDPVNARAGMEYWLFHQGSAEIRIFIYEGNYLYATSPLNDLPKKNLKELYHYILTEDHEPYRLAISDGQIFISYRTHISDLFSLSDKEVIEHLSGMAKRADDLDDLFVNEYGASMTSFSKTA